MLEGIYLERRTETSNQTVISFLNRNYLSETAKFGHHKWNYYQSFCDDDFSITTNSLENVNGRFIIGRFIIE